MTVPGYSLPCKEFSGYCKLNFVDRLSTIIAGSFHVLVITHLAAIQIKLILMY